MVDIASSPWASYTDHIRTILPEFGTKGNSGFMTGRNVEEASVNERVDEMLLLLFAHTYIEKCGIELSESPRTPEEYVRLAGEDIAAGVFGVNPEGESLFVFFAAAVAYRIDLDRNTPRPPASGPKKSKSPGH